jgi:type IV pilus secretin PilQ/predicted competence protein
MKTRLSTFRDASHRAKCIGCGIPLVLLAFATAGAKAEDTSTKLPQAQAAASAPKIPGSATVSKKAAGPVAGEFGVLTDVKLAPETDKVTVTVLTDRLIEPNEFNLSDPPRLVLDFPNTRNRIKPMELPVHAASVKQLRIQQFQTTPSKIARIVFDLENSSGKHEISLDKSFVRVVFSAKSQPVSLSSAKAPTPALSQGENPAKKSTAPPVPTPARTELPRTADSGAAQKSRSAESLSEAVSSAPESSAAQPAQPKAPKTGMFDVKTGLAWDSSRSEVHKDVSATPKKETTVKPNAPPEALPLAENLAKKPMPPPAPAPARSESPKTVDSGTAQKLHSAEPLSKTVSSTPESSSSQPRALSTGMPDLKARPATDSSPSNVNEDISGTSKKETAAKSKTPAEAAPITQSPHLPEPTELAKALQIKNSEKLRVPETNAKEPNPVNTVVAALAPSATAALPKMISPANSRFFGQPLTLDLINIPLVDFFRLMAEEGGINIVMDPEIKGNISIKVVKVPWDQIFEAALSNNGLDKQVEGTLVRIAKKSTLQDEAKQRESLKKATLLAADLETRIKRLNYTKAAALVSALADQKTVRGTVVVDERSNSLILTDLPSSLDKLSQLIDSLDMPQPQVEIEARIVSATRDFARDIGIQFGFVDGNLERVTVGGPNTFGTIGGTRPSATPTSTFSAGTSTGRGASESTSSDSAGVSTGTSSNNKGNWNVNLPATRAFGGLGISIGNIFDTFLLDAAITAGENKGLAKLISQPKVTAQNNSPAVITQGLRFPVQIVANNTVTVQFQNAALTLTVTPQITYEGNIVLDLKVENNTPDFSRQVNGIPSIRTSESTTRVLVSDGGTTVIGGILIDNETNQEDKVPGLGSLPLVGNLFRRTSVSRSTQEVLFFVTPRIIK